MEWKATGGSFEQAPAGSHIARCIKLIDIGTHKNEYQGQVSFPRQVIVAWELPNELMTSGEYEGKPFNVSRFYTASLHEKSTLRKDLINWRGRDFTEEELGGFDPKKILGAPCMLSLSLNDKQKIKVSGVMAAPKGMTVPAQINESVYFSLEPNQFKQEVFDSLSDGIKKLIEVSPEYQSLKGVEPAPLPKQNGDSFDNFEDDIPF
jgi:hypothetical protein